MMESLIGKIRSLDAYPKINEDFYSRTLSGGFITLASTIVMILLFISELKASYLGRTVEEYILLLCLAAAREAIIDSFLMACLLKTRSVIRLRGPETIKFLQGLVTNDMRSLDHPQTEAAAPLYAAMLTPQGRFFYDLFLYRPLLAGEKSGLEIYADVDGSVVDELLSTLKKYRLRSKVDIENVGEDFSCWQRFGRDLEADYVGWGQGNNIGWNWHKDPRLTCLGYRGVFPSNATPPLVEEDKETDEGNFLLWRLEKGVAEGSSEIPKGEAIPLEYNLVGLNAISFDKGCYVGQELIARTHHRGVIRKRLIPVRFVSSSGKEVEQQVSPGSQVIDNASKKKVGTVTTALGSHGLALVRLEEAFKETGALTISDQEDIKIETIRPKWWPSEWFPF